MRHPVTMYVQGFEKNKPVFHVITFDWHYWQIKSLNAFFDRMVAAYLRVREDANSREKYNWERSTDLGFCFFMDRFPNTKVVRHNSVWDFYDHIGYHYKNSSMKKVVWK